jgi:transcriptional regulator with XRE-family HTH domain
MSDMSDKRTMDSAFVNTSAHKTLLYVQHKLTMRRIANGWTQKDLALMIGAASNAMSAIESGRRIPSVNRLIAWADALGMEFILTEKAIDNED